MSRSRRGLSRKWRDLEVRAETAEAFAASRLGLLRRMPEWSYDIDQACYFCWICGNNKDYGHADDCELAKELDNG